MKAHKPFSMPFSPSPTQATNLRSPIVPQKLLHTHFALSKTSLPPRQRVTRCRTTSHTLKFDFPNLHSCSELCKINLLFTQQHIRALPHSFSKASIIHELSIIIISDRWQLNYRKTLVALFRTLPHLRAVSTLNLYLYNTLALDRTVMKALTSSLNRLKRLKNFNLRLQWCQNVSFESVPKLLRPLRRNALEEVTVSFLGDVLQTRKKTKTRQIQLVDKLNRFVQCRALALELDLNISFSDSDLLTLGNRVNKIKGLQCFCLKLGTRNRLSHGVSTADYVTDEGIVGLLNSLDSLHTLQELSIHLISCNKITEAGVFTSVESHFRPHRFRALNFKFESFSITKYTQIFSLIELLSNFQDPKNVHLRVQNSPDFAITYTRASDHQKNFHQKDSISNEIQLSCDIPPGLNWEEYHTFARMFSQLPNLVAFDFTCRDNAYTWELVKEIPSPKPLPTYIPNTTSTLLHLLISIDENIRASQTHSIISLLDKLKHIQELRLSFSYCRTITEETLTHIMKLLSLFSDLQCLKISFKGCPNATDIVILSLSEALHSYKRLNSLSVEFEASDVISNVSIFKLFIGIQSLCFLKNLSIAFQSCPLITSEGLQGLTSVINNLKRLRELFIAFPDIVQMSNIELKKLGASVSELKKLKNLKMDFSSCRDISDEGLCAFGESFVQVQGVKYLEIHLDDCWNLGNEGIHQVAKSIKTLKELYSLKMSLKGCKNITAEGINQFVGEICEISKLQYLTLDFGSGENVTGEIFHKADVFLKFERMENISVNLKASKEIITERVDELRKKLGEVRQVVIFFK